VDSIGEDGTGIEGQGHQCEGRGCEKELDPCQGIQLCHSLAALETPEGGLMRGEEGGGKSESHRPMFQLRSSHDLKDFVDLIDVIISREKRR
jgi:hypothetical protein